MRVRLAVAAVATGLLVVGAVVAATPKPAVTKPAIPPAPAGVQFSPSGSVKHVKQVVARFPRAMVGFGDPNPSRAPFRVDCATPGTARWLDPRTWVYEFVREVPGGLMCTFALDADVKALDGTPVPGAREFRFDSGGPAVLSTLPSEGDTISEDQTFVLVLDALPTDAALQQHVSFAIDGIAEKIAFDVVGGAERDAVLKEQRPHPEPDEQLVVVRARRRFPSEAGVRLVWGQGIAAASGPPTAQEQVLSWTVRPAFSAEHYCQRLTKEGPCLPITPMALRFSNGIPRARAGDVALVAPDGTRIAAVPPDDDDPAVVERVVFRGPFTESSTYRLTVPADLADIEGRALSNADRFPMDVKIGPFPPLAKFAARFGILEAKAQPALPVTVRGIEPDIATRLRTIGTTGGTTGAAPAVAGGQQLRVDPSDPHEMIGWLRRVAAAGREHSVFGKRTGPTPAKFTVPTTTRGKSMEVVGIPLDRPGLHVVELESPRLGAALLDKPKPMFVAAAALVTNMAVHLKRGREGSLVWVTTLDSGAPVGGAAVTLVTCKGDPVWSGQTDADGIARLGAIPGLSESGPYCPLDDIESDATYDLFDSAPLRAITNGWFAIARLGDDVSFVHSEWNDGIEPWRFQVNFEMAPPPFVAHTVFDRALFRSGDTVHMKHVLRARTVQGLEALPEAERPKKVEIQHQGTNQTWELPLLWDAAGSAESTWPIPAGAKLGTYTVRLAGADAEHTADTGSFRVEEFRLPLLRATLKAPAEPQIATAAMTVDASVQYLAGGAAGALPVTLRALLEPRYTDAPDDFEGFTFGNGAVKEGIEHNENTDEEDGESEGAASPGRTVHQRLQATLDAAGAARLQITDLPPATEPRLLRAELEYRDPSGEVHTAVTTVPLFPAQWIAGVRTSLPSDDGGPVRVQVGVIDPTGKPVADAPVKVTAFSEVNYAIRKRVVGGVYSYEYVTERRKLGPFCDGRTDAAGKLSCTAEPPARGWLVLEATATDPAGHATAAYDSVVVSGDRDATVRVGDTDRIDLVPDRKQYEPGETAHLQVRMPFRSATALVAVEREGVRTAKVVPLTAEQATIDVPVTDADAPNVFVSVLAVRGRVGDVQPTAMVDLGRPAFKLGIAELKVGWRSHRLRVGVAAAHPVYHVREHARVKVAVQTADGAPLPTGAEVMVAAVDEALLDLAPNASWQVLGPMMGQRSYGVMTATAAMQVVGKRHFGQKAKPTGGGGGRQPTRELFDTLLLWRARVPLDARGRALLDVPLNDSLTSFKIVAVATAGLDRFGTGGTSIRATQDLMLLSGLPAVVRDADQLRAEFTVRNTTDRRLDVTVTPSVDRLASPPAPVTVALAAGEAHPLEWEVTVPAGVDQLRWDVVAATRDGSPRDELKVTQAVKRAVAVTTVQGMLYRAGDGQPAVPVRRPDGALPERGDVEVQLSSRLADGLDGVRQAMREYPYECLEQQVSRAVTLNEPARWRAIVDTLPSYADSDGLFKFFPTSREGSEVLTAYVLSVSRAAGFALPKAIVESATQALRQFVEGGLQRTTALGAADRTLRKLAAIDALARYGQADAALVSTLAIEPDLWPTSALLDWWDILRRVPKLPDAARRRTEVERIVRARLNQQGTVVKFATEDQDFLWWLMTCPDGNAARLMLDRLDANEWRDDLPKLMAGTLARQRRGAWGCTTANAWGRLASDAFSHAFESTPVTGRTTVRLGAASRDLDWAQSAKGDAFHIAWPATPGSLDVTHDGTGAPWVTLRGRAAVPITAPVAHGYRVTRTLVPVERKVPEQWSRGDIVRVRLEIAADADFTWVVVDDPIPAGASHLGTGLGTAPAQADGSGDASSGIEPTFVERGFEGMRAYYEVMPGGRTVLEYTIRLNQAGTFQQPATHVEAMYDPDVSGDAPNPPFVVVP